MAGATGLTVVVPCLNEGAAVRRMYAEVTAALAGVGTVELMLVDDGSTDDTLQHMKALAAADPRVRYLSLSRNFGLEAAQSAGFRYASQPWTVQLDCDLQFPPSEIHKLLAAAADGYDVVFGVREHRQDSWWRRWASAGQHWVAQHIFGIRIPAGASTFRVVRTAVARTIAEQRVGTPYFIAMIPQLGASYTRVPVAHHPRQDGGSRFRLSRLVGHSFELLFGYSWRPLNAGYLVAGVGVTTAALLAVLGMAGAAGPVALGVGAVLLAGTTLATVALVGRYLHRLLLDQRRGRPYYIREANVPLLAADRIDSGEDRVPPPLPGPTGALLVLGASADQLPLYRAARRRGLVTIAVDRQPDAPAVAAADRYLHLSVRDAAGVVAALGGDRPAAVVTAGSDLSLASWHELTERFATPYRYPATAVAASTDKAAFHALTAAAGARGYRWRHGRDQRALAAQAGEVGFPLVAKPADSSGSKGVTLVSGAAELPAALAYAARFSTSGDLLIEECLTGRHLTVDVFMRDGDAAFAAVSEKLIEAGRHFLVRGHAAPAPLDPATYQRLVALATQLCREVGLRDGPADFDVVLGADGEIRVLEVNCRLCGDALPLLLREVYGVDLVEAVVSLALGEPVDVTPRGTGTGAGVLHALTSPLPGPGRLSQVHGLDTVRHLPGVAACELYVAPGAVIPAAPHSGHKFGYLLAVGPDLTAAEATVATAVEVLAVTVEPAAGESPSASAPVTLPAVNGVTAASPVPAARRRPEGAPHRVP